MLRLAKGEEAGSQEETAAGEPSKTSGRRVQPECEEPLEHSFYALSLMSRLLRRKQEALTARWQVDC